MPTVVATMARWAKRDTGKPQALLGFMNLDWLSVADNAA